MLVRSGGGGSGSGGTSGSMIHGHSSQNKEEEERETDRVKEIVSDPELSGRYLTPLQYPPFTP